MLGDHFEIATCADCRDAWTWLVVYRDGSMLHECDGQNPHAAYADIDIEQVDKMALIPLRDGLPQLVVQIAPGMRPIFFRRRLIELQIADGDTVGSQTIHCLGYSTNGNGPRTEHFTFVFDDGSTLLSNDRNAV